MSGSRGFTLLEVLIVVTVLGLIAAIAMPSLVDALDRGRRSSTMGDLRAAGTALERYAFDHHRYPVAEDLAGLRPLLVPEYAKKLPLEDGWGHSFVLEVDEAGSSYTLSSPGKDGVFQTEGVGDGFAADIVYSEGVFLSDRPEEGVAGDASSD